MNEIHTPEEAKQFLQSQSLITINQVNRLRDKFEEHLEKVLEDDSDSNVDRLIRTMSRCELLKNTEDFYLLDTGDLINLSMIVDALKLCEIEPGCPVEKTFQVHITL